MGPSFSPLLPRQQLPPVWSLKAHRGFRIVPHQPGDPQIPGDGHSVHSALFAFSTLPDLPRRRPQHRRPFLTNRLYSLGRLQAKLVGMGMCEYCGTSAGWFSSSHPACVGRVESTAKTVNAFVVETLLGGGTLADLTLGVQKILSDNNTKQQYVHGSLMDGLDAGISQFSKKAPISNDDYTRIKAICAGFDAESADAIKRNMSLRHFGKIDMELSNVLWQAQNDCLQHWPGSMFNLHRGEILCYQCESSAVLAEEKTVTTGRGYVGISVPLGNGIYGHLGESKPQKVSGLMPIDGGALAITTENIYFAGGHTTAQISLRHVVPYQPYVDGIGIYEAHGVPKVFTLFQDCQFPDGRSLSGCTHYDIGWFLYPLLTTLTNRINQQ